MASERSTVDYIVEQVAGAGDVLARRMFGEYGIFCDGRMVAVVCDDQLFVTPTAAGRAYVGDPVERPPFPRAKPYLFVSGELWDDGDWLTGLIRITAAERPPPVRKRRTRG